MATVSRPRRWIRPESRSAGDQPAVGTRLAQNWHLTRIPTMATEAEAAGSRLTMTSSPLTGGAVSAHPRLSRAGRGPRTKPACLLRGAIHGPATADMGTIPGRCRRICRAQAASAGRCRPRRRHRRKGAGTKTSTSAVRTPTRANSAHLACDGHRSPTGTTSAMGGVRCASERGGGRTILARASERGAVDPGGEVAEVLSRKSTTAEGRKQPDRRSMAAGHARRSLLDQRKEADPGTARSAQLVRKAQKHVARGLDRQGGSSARMPGKEMKQTRRRNSMSTDLFATGLQTLRALASSTAFSRRATLAV